MGKWDRIKKGLGSLFQFVGNNLSSLSSSAKESLVQFLQNIGPQLSKLREAEQEQPEIQPTQIPDSARLLWVASGGDPQAFIQYLNSYPDPNLQSLLRNPSEIQNLIKNLSKEIPQGIPQVSSEGIEPSWLPSSNVFGYKYDQNTKKMYVKFNGKNSKSTGPLYVYENVPKEIAQIVSSGSIPAKTTGQNKWGRWWKSKSPSIGSSVSALLKNGGYQYRKLS